MVPIQERQLIKDDVGMLVVQVSTFEKTNAKFHGVPIKFGSVPNCKNFIGLENRIINAPIILTYSAQQLTLKCFQIITQNSRFVVGTLMFEMEQWTSFNNNKKKRILN